MDLMDEWIAQVPNRGGHGAGHKKLDLKESHEESVRSDGPRLVRDFRAISPSYTPCAIASIICLLAAWIDLVICLDLLLLQKKRGE